jgi:transposase
MIAFVSLCLGTVSLSCIPLFRSSSAKRSFLNSPPSNSNFTYNNATTMPIDKATRKRRETTTEERISVIGKNAEGKSYRDIAEIAGISKVKAADIRKERQQHNIEDSTRSGRSSKLSDSDARYLKMLSDKDLSTPLAKITRERALREKGYYVHIARKKPFLTKHKKIN